MPGRGLPRRSRFRRQRLVDQEADRERPFYLQDRRCIVPQLNLSELPLPVEGRMEGSHGMNPSRDGVQMGGGFGTHAVLTLDPVMDLFEHEAPLTEGTLQPLLLEHAIGDINIGPTVASELPAV